jgi:hypothetical protein
MRAGQRVLGVSLLVFVAAAMAASAKDDADPLAKGTKWTGKLTQKGKIEGTESPLSLEVTLTVTRRDGTEFKADLYEKGAESTGVELTYLVTGTVVPANDGKEFTVKFQSFDVKDEKSRVFLNIPYSGTITGKTLKGTWKHPPNVVGTTIEGDFTLELQREPGSPNRD